MCPKKRPEMSGTWLSLYYYKITSCNISLKRVVIKTKESQAWHGRLVLLLVVCNKQVFERQLLF